MTEPVEIHVDATGAPVDPDRVAAALVRQPARVLVPSLADMRKMQTADLHVLRAEFVHAISAIESQLEAYDGESNPEWERRARSAMRKFRIGCTDVNAVVKSRHTPEHSPVDHPEVAELVDAAVSFLAVPGPDGRARLVAALEQVERGRS